MLEAIKKSVQLYFGGKQKLKPHRLGMVKDLSNVSSTALFFCINSVEELTDIRKLLKKVRKTDKHLMAFVFYPEYQTLDVVTEKSLFFFNLNDFTLFAKMKDKLRMKVEETTFELLISFVQMPDKLCLHLLSEIRADFKVGSYQLDVQGDYDLSLKTDIRDTGFLQYFHEVHQYLQVLNIEAKLK